MGIKRKSVSGAVKLSLWADIGRIPPQVLLMPRFPLAFCQHKMLVAMIEGRIRGHAYSHIYSDENGETHFRDIDIEISEVGPDGLTAPHRRDYLRLEFTFERRQPIGFSIGARQTDVNTSST
jgi:hypothetical protein